MARVRLYNVFSNLKVEDFMRFVSAFLGSLVDEFNGKIDFVQNIRASGIHSVTFTSGSDIQSVDHKLGRVPSGWLLINLSTTGSIFKPSGAQYEWTSSTIYLQASNSTVAQIYVI